jgi:16S rRNA (cytosine967-C5)-methyltransferase
MILLTQSLTERVIRNAGPDHPADAVLRDVLKAERVLLPGDAAEVSRAVFGYYRWRGWLNDREPLSQQVRCALDLADRFARRPDSFSDAELISRSLPAWAKDEMAVSASGVRALQAEPKLWLRARPGQGKLLSRKLGDCKPFGADALADILEYVGQADLFRTPEFHAGEFELQDLSSQAVGLVCAPQPGETWWDVCAGEGGKLLHLSDLMKNKGLIWASDRAAWRLQKLKRRAARAKVFNYRAVAWDGGRKLPTKTKFDGVLLDAPCSGIGTWQRNPHARWTTTPADVAELGELQKQILAHASAAVKPGGKLVYAVCTLARSETLRVAEDFEGRFPEFEPLPFTNPLEPGSAPTPGLLLTPEQHGGNGMFIAAWRRRAPP